MQNYKKIEIEVIGRFNKNGLFFPMSIIWFDGKIYPVDNFLKVERRAATKVGGTGMRYKVVIEGKEKNLFREEDRWFVEAKAD